MCGELVIVFWLLKMNPVSGTFPDSKDMENPELEIDLPSQEIRRPNGAVIKFEIDPFRKKCLLEGLDDIGITMQQSRDIKEFETKMSNERPWL